MADEKVAPIIIVKKKINRKHGHHGGAWKVAYADFVTAMMAFFLVMWLLGADEEVKQAIEQYFKDPGSMSPMSSFENPSKGGEQILPQDAFRVPSGGRAMDMPTGKVNVQTEAEDELVRLKDLLEESISVELGMSSLAEQYEMTYDKDGLTLRISVKNFFDHGEAEPKMDLKPLIYKIGQALSTSKRLVRVEGHADRSETNSAEFASTWELSTARAGWVAKYWLGSFPEMMANRVQVAGNSYHRPIATGDTEEARAANRRVDIIVLSSEYKYKHEE